MWQSLIVWLTWLAADPHAVSTEAAKASGAVSVAYAATATDVAPAPVPVPKPGCCEDCGGKGVIVHGDGHRTPCPCQPSCKCKLAPGAALTSGGRAAPAGEAAR